MFANISLQKIRYFISVVECGSITKAALRLHISASVISNAIRDIEDEAGKILLERKREGMAPNQMGFTVYHKFRDVISLLDGIPELKDEFRETSGKIVMAVSTTVSDLFLFPLLRDLKRVFPEIEIELVEPVDLENLRELGAKIDFCLMITSNYAKPKNFNEIALHSFPRRLWVSEKNPLAEKTVITFDDIKKEKYIQCTLDNLEYFIHRHFHPKTIFRTMSIEATKAMVGANMGVAIMPDNDYTFYSSYGDRILRRKIKGEDLFMELGVLLPKGKKSTEATDSILEFLKSRKWDRL